MSPIETLLSRKSHAKLTSPAPTKEQLEILFKAALRAPDHALLKPWRYRVFSGSELTQLGELFVKASLDADADLSEQSIERIRNKPMRAPMVIVASVFFSEHPKVPHIEQILSAGASVQNLLVAAHFLKIGAMWRTGALAFNDFLKQYMGLADNEQIIGFIYLGKEQGEKRAVEHPPIEEFVSWYNE